MLNKIKTFWPSGIFFLSVMNLMLFGYLLITTRTQLQVQYIPDDAYYYLTLARNFSDFGQWTFDQGISQTSGFHPLFAYLLALPQMLFNFSPAAFVTYGAILTLCFVLMTSGLVFLVGKRAGYLIFLPLVAVIGTSPNFVYNSFSITEWSVTLLCAAAYFLFFCRMIVAPEISRRQIFWLSIIGLLGSLSRTDFGLFPLVIAVVTVAYYVIGRLNRSATYAAIAGLVGASLGVFAGFAHSFYFTNEWIQSSALMKSYWSEYLSPSYLAVPYLLMSLTGVLGLAVLFSLIIVLLVSFRNRNQNAQDSLFQDKTGSLSSMMFWVATLTLAGYLIFYSRNGAIQPWYTANLITPLLILLYLLSAGVSKKLDENIQMMFAAFAGIVMMVNIFNLYPLDDQKSPWPHQQQMLEGGNFLHSFSSDCPIGAWNAGIIGYYQGGEVINLDGLVNNDIYPFAIENEVPSYLQAAGICYVIDFDGMFDSTFLRQSRGFNDPEFIANLVPEESFVDGMGQHWGALTLYRYQP